MKILEQTTNQEIYKHRLENLLNGEENIVNENANKDSRVFNTMRDLTAGVVSKQYALDHMLPPHVKNAHLNGDIHFHDLDYHPFLPMTNCCLIDVQNMLQNGFKIGNAEVSRPKSIQTAAAQIAQIIANVASSQYGGASIDRIDEILEPYAQLNYDKYLREAKNWMDDKHWHNYAKEKTYKDIYDAMQSLEYEVNTLFTSNGQTPFVTFGFGLGTSEFSRQIQKSIFSIRIEGIGENKQTAIFPKLVFSIKKGINFNAEDPNYDIKQLALECSTKRMYPDILNYDKLVEIVGDFKVPMGCRSFLSYYEENKKNINAGRNNLGVTTLNIPRIALESEGDIEIFFKILERKLDIIRDANLYRIKRISEANPENAPILYQNGALLKKLKKEDDIMQLFLNEKATISVGYIGLYEAATVFFGPNWEKNKEAKDFTLDILKNMKTRADNWSKKYGIRFSIYATPSESLTDRFAQMDYEKFGSIADITDKSYYTNSYHYDVRKKPTPFEKLDFEAIYPFYSPGGFIHYAEYPKMTHNLKALEQVWDYSYDKVAYLGTNTPIDKCFQCDFEGEFLTTEEGFKCPSCGNDDPDTVDVVKRTCGYLGNPAKRPMARGRHKEIKARVKHVKSESNDN